MLYRSLTFHDTAVFARDYARCPVSSLKRQSITQNPEHTFNDCPNFPLPEQPGSASSIPASQGASAPARRFGTCTPNDSLVSALHCQVQGYKRNNVTEEFMLLGMSRPETHPDHPTLSLLWLLQAKPCLSALASKLDICQSGLVATAGTWDDRDC